MTITRYIPKHYLESFDNGEMNIVDIVQSSINKLTYENMYKNVCPEKFDFIQIIIASKEAR